MSKKSGGCMPGRPAKYAHGGKVEGVSQHKALAMGGGSGKVESKVTPKGTFQRKK